MRRLTITITIMFLSGIFLSELPVIIHKLYPQTAEIEYSLFLDNKVEQKITVLWYLYEISDLLNRMIWAYAFCKLASFISVKLFKVGMTFVFYYASQFVLYLWNRNSSGISNWCVIGCIIFVLYFLIFWPDREKGKLKSLE